MKFIGMVSLVLACLGALMSGCNASAGMQVEDLQSLTVLGVTPRTTSQEPLRSGEPAFFHVDVLTSEPFYAVQWNFGGAALQNETFGNDISVIMLGEGVYNATVTVESPELNQAVRYNFEIYIVGGDAEGVVTVESVMVDGPVRMIGHFKGLDPSETSRGVNLGHQFSTDGDIFFAQDGMVLTSVRIKIVADPEHVSRAWTGYPEALGGMKDRVKIVFVPSSWEDRDTESVFDINFDPPIAYGTVPVLESEWGIHNNDPTTIRYELVSYATQPAP